MKRCPTSFVTREMHRNHSDIQFNAMMTAMMAKEKEMATHSSVPAWRIPGMGEPGGLPSMGSHRVGHDCSDLAAAAAGWLKKIFSKTSSAENMEKLMLRM